jgi:hypothetical protein
MAFNLEALMKMESDLRNARSIRKKEREDRKRESKADYWRNKNYTDSQIKYLNQLYLQNKQWERSDDNLTESNAKSAYAETKHQIDVLEEQINEYKDSNKSYTRMINDYKQGLSADVTSAGNSLVKKMQNKEFSWLEKLASAEGKLDKLDSFLGELELIDDFSEELDAHFMTADRGDDFSFDKKEVEDIAHNFMYGADSRAKKLKADLSGIKQQDFTSDNLDEPGAKRALKVLEDMTNLLVSDQGVEALNRARRRQDEEFIAINQEDRAGAKRLYDEALEELRALEKSDIAQVINHDDYKPGDFPELIEASALETIKSQSTYYKNEYATINTQIDMLKSKQEQAHDDIDNIAGALLDTAFVGGSDRFAYDEEDVDNILDNLNISKEGVYSGQGKDMEGHKYSSAYNSNIAKVATENNMDANFLKAIVQQENPQLDLSAKSEDDAWGLTQMTDDALKDVNRTFKTNYTLADMTDADKSLDAGAKYYKLMYAQAKELSERFPGIKESKEEGAKIATVEQIALSMYNGGAQATITSVENDRELLTGEENTTYRLRIPQYHKLFKSGSGSIVNLDKLKDKGYLAEQTKLKNIRISNAQTAYKQALAMENTALENNKLYNNVKSDMIAAGSELNDIATNDGIKARDARYNELFAQNLPLMILGKSRYARAFEGMLEKNPTLIKQGITDITKVANELQGMPEEAQIAELLYKAAKSYSAANEGVAPSQDWLKGVKRNLLTGPLLKELKTYSSENPDIQDLIVHDKGTIDMLTLYQKEAGLNIVIPGTEEYLNRNILNVYNQLENQGG